MEQIDQIEMRGKMAVALELIEGCEEFTALIPEVRTNLVYALPNAKTRDDVLAVDGRITVVSCLLYTSPSPRD